MVQKTNNICRVLLSLFLTSCAIGPKDPNGTYADMLNGENSRSGMSVGVGVPLIISNPNPVQRRISGKIFCGEGIAETLIRNADIELKKDTKVVAQGSWREGGTFVIQASFDRNTHYIVAVKTRCGEGSKPVPLNLLSDLTDFNFHLHQSLSGLSQSYY
jgi:hypothetical protein